MNEILTQPIEHGYYWFKGDVDIFDDINEYESTVIQYEGRENIYIAGYDFGMSIDCFKGQFIKIQQPDFKE